MSDRLDKTAVTVVESLAVLPAKMTFEPAETFKEIAYPAGPNGEGSSTLLFIQEVNTEKLNARRITLKNLILDFISCLLTHH